MPIQRINLTASPKGLAFRISSGFTTIHTTETSSSIIDVVHLWGYTPGAGTASQIYLYLPGSTVSSTDTLVTTVSSSAMVKLIDGLQIVGDGTTGTILRGYSPNSNVFCMGYILRITT